MWTECGVTDGEQVTIWKIKHPDYDRGVRAPTPEVLKQVTVRVTYCATEKGNVVVQGELVS